ncbi:MAG: hypothetical protein CIT01_07145 [Methanobacterium sp. BRmetb2]|nr:MAG: hypothetical protein CIT01_07145 [Methanobacterium sp. BRmetb2]
MLVKKVTIPILHVNLKEDISWDGIELVISHSKFSKIVNRIKIIKMMINNSALELILLCGFLISGMMT